MAQGLDVGPTFRRLDRHQLQTVGVERPEQLGVGRQRDGDRFPLLAAGEERGDESRGDLEPFLLLL